MEHTVVTDYTNVNVENDSVKVYVRARPPAEGSKLPTDMFVLPDETPQRKITIRDVTNRSYGEHAFQFDRVFWTDDDQEAVYEEVAVKLINHCLDGYNSCCFAYGQTGSGKTYSMFGEGGEQRGIIPRSVEHIFSALEDRSRTKEVAVLVSFLEMYCDMIRDLGKAYLDKSSRPDSASRQKTSDWFHRGKVSAASFNTKSDAYSRQDLDIHEDADGNVFVKDLSVIPVTTPEEVVTIMQMGFRLRATHETKMNSVSSRSHTVFTITIVQKDKATGETVTGMLNLVDLAGSERLRKSESEGVRLREALSINSSLSALGKVIMALDPSLPSSFVPYRDSKLTRLLQNSLGGNSFTSLLATVHPRQYDYDECLSTMHFANRCRNVRNQPRVNYIDNSGADKDRHIKRLIQEVADLKRSLFQLQSAAAVRMHKVLADLGIKGEMLPDGRFQTADGKIIGLSSDGAAGLVGEDGQFDPTALAAAMGGSGGAGGFKSAKQAAAHREAEARMVSALKEKLAARKEEIARVKDQSKREITELRTMLQHQRRQLEDAKHGEFEKAVRLKGALEEAEGAFGSQVGALVENNARLMRQQNELLRSIPDSLRVSSDVIERASNIEKVMRKEAAEKSKRDLRALRASCDKELASEKLKFQAFRKQLEGERDAMIDDISRWRETTTAEMTLLKSELASVYQYAAGMSTLVDDMISGKHPVRQASSGHRAFAVPAKALPKDPVAGLATKSPLLTSLLEEHGRFVVHSGAHGIAAASLTAGSPRSVRSRRSTPRSAVGVIREAQRSRHAENLWVSDADAGTQPASLRAGAGTGERAEGGARPPSGAPPRATSSHPRHMRREASEGSMMSRKSSRGSVGPEESVEDGVGRVASLVLADLGLEKRLEEMSDRELSRHAKVLRDFIQGDFRAQVEEQVVNDLAEHETVDYIRKLEDEKLHYQTMWKEESQKHRELRAAYNATQRSLRKTTDKLGQSRRRPQSAIAFGSSQRPSTAGSSRPTSAQRHYVHSRPQTAMGL